LGRSIFLSRIIAADSDPKFSPRSQVRGQPAPE
jgi:hypothetical protein